MAAHSLKRFHNLWKKSGETLKFPSSSPLFLHHCSHRLSPAGEVFIFFTRLIFQRFSTLNQLTLWSDDQYCYQGRVRTTFLRTFFLDQIRCTIQAIVWWTISNSLISTSWCSSVPHCPLRVLLLLLLSSLNHFSSAPFLLPLALCQHRLCFVQVENSIQGSYKSLTYNIFTLIDSNIRTLENKLIKTVQVRNVEAFIV